MPNAVARSALFTVNVGDARANLKRQVIASEANVLIEYTGEELRVDDEDVLLQLIHLARMLPLGMPITFSSHAIIKALGWSLNTRSYDRLKDSIIRMRATNVSIRFVAKGEWKEYNESLILSADHGGKKEQDKTHSLWRLTFSPKIMVMFKESSYTQLDWQTRLRLPPLAKKLHTLYMTHVDPSGTPVETLKGITGSRIQQLKHFRYKLREALDLLVSIGFLSHFAIDKATDLVRVSKHSRSSPLLRSLDN
jgi:hypothetical protein